ncbi:hypothetical protein PENSPDRAFT_654668 [Peniophora sp. CONT]|nr:hypothetical protein PENSPDRAFT_654668 [Peniophora sp. CONT]
MLINSIPTDILCEIFAALKEAYPTRQFAQSKQAGPGYDAHLQRLGWLAVTFVNRRWRSVAIEDALLWSDLPIHLGPEWLQSFVLRSKDVALTYDGIGGGGGDKAKRALSDIYSSVLPTHMHRMRKITLYSVTQDLMQTSLSQPAPILTSLALYGDLRSHVPLFSGQAPCLRSLTFGAYPRQAGLLLKLDDQHSILRGITSLSLSLYQDVLPVHTVVEILRHAKKLETLNLTFRSETFPYVAPEEICSLAKTAELPALKSCVLGGRIDGIAHLVSHLRLPLSIMMTIQCDCSPLRNHPDSPDFRQLVESLAAWRFGYSEDGPRAPFRVARLQSDLNGTATLKFAAYPAIEATLPFAIPSEDCFTLVLRESLDSSGRSTELRPTIYSNILPILFSHGEALLVLSDTITHPYKRLRQLLLCTLPRLEQICSPSHTLDTAIVPDLDLPSLRVLHLINPPSFDDAYVKTLGFSLRVHPETSANRKWGRLRSMLLERRQAGLHLDRIVIHYEAKAYRFMRPDMFAEVKSFMEDVVEIDTIETMERFWDSA